MAWILSSSPAHANTASQTTTSSNAYHHPIRVLVLDDLTMLIGPDLAGRLLEIGISTREGIDFIVDAMPARPKFVR